MARLDANLRRAPSGRVAGPGGGKVALLSVAVVLLVLVVASKGAVVIWWWSLAVLAFTLGGPAAVLLYLMFWACAVFTLSGWV